MELIILDEGHMHMMDWILMNPGLMWIFIGIYGLLSISFTIIIYWDIKKHNDLSIVIWISIVLILNLIGFLIYLIVREFKTTKTGDDVKSNSTSLSGFQSSNRNTGPHYNAQLTSQKSTRSMIYCSNCGKEILSDSRYCPFCGIAQTKKYDRN